MWNDSRSNLIRTTDFQVSFSFIEGEKEITRISKRDAESRMLEGFQVFRSLSTRSRRVNLQGAE